MNEQQQQDPEAVDTWGAWLAERAADRARNVDKVAARRAAWRDNAAPAIKSTLEEAAAHLGAAGLEVAAVVDVTLTNAAVLHLSQPDRATDIAEAGSSPRHLVELGARLVYQQSAAGLVCVSIIHPRYAWSDEERPERKIIELRTVEPAITSAAVREDVNRLTGMLIKGTVDMIPTRPDAPFAAAPPRAKAPASSRTSPGRGA